MDQNEVFNYLMELSSVDFSQQEVGSKTLSGDFNTVDFWESKADILVIKGGLVIAADLSYGKYGKVILVGKFNRADFAEAVIGRGRGIIDVSRAQIIHFDLTETKVGKIIMGPETVIENLYIDGANIKNPIIKNGAKVGIVVGTPVRQGLII